MKVDILFVSQFALCGRYYITIFKCISNTPKNQIKKVNYYIWVKKCINLLGAQIYDNMENFNNLEEKIRVDENQSIFLRSIYSFFPALKHHSLTNYFSIFLILKEKTLKIPFKTSISTAPPQKFIPKIFFLIWGKIRCS